MTSEPRFTLVFSGDLRAFAGNPFHADTPFGRPVVVSVGDATEEALTMTDEHVDLLAQTMCAAYWQDNVPPTNVPIWSALSPVTKGQWRRAARAAMRTLEVPPGLLVRHKARNDLQVSQRKKPATGLG